MQTVGSLKDKQSPFGKCNCGLPAKWLHAKQNVMSCNKYVVCPTYAELEDKIDALNLKIKNLEAYFNARKLVEELDQKISASINCDGAPCH